MYWNCDTFFTLSHYWIFLYHTLIGIGYFTKCKIIYFFSILLCTWEQVLHFHPSYLSSPYLWCIVICVCVFAVNGLISFKSISVNPLNAVLDSHPSSWLFKRGGVKIYCPSKTICVYLWNNDFQPSQTFYALGCVFRADVYNMLLWR